MAINFSNDPADITSFLDAYQNFLAGKTNVTTDIAGTLDMTAGAGDATLFAALGTGAVTTVMDPTGSGPAAGDPEYTCTAPVLTGALLASYNTPLPAGGAAPVALPMASRASRQERLD